MQLLLLVCVVYWTLGRTNSEVLKKHIYFYLCLEDTREAPSSQPHNETAASFLIVLVCAIDEFVDRYKSIPTEINEQSMRQDSVTFH